ncbi:hypothetical protein SJAG_05014 [Schizosaccharomyces japonicus yFS275]|uniref:MIF4G domain-containing protein n=1 Tax=Schizosaccharomyces japonicus (strain yFS275 / FY16936) TaxID=402676 RepID=B6K8D6_SCHJY|nr:hypothetical protein SJAG_05014 [Schizosaccharomyces japonicus yFS275]EEB09790.1 hypothetical protein SJAG_05014 [Schizosaccharomyces japonicus yFS275]
MSDGSLNEKLKGYLQDRRIDELVRTGKNDTLTTNAFLDSSLKKNTAFMKRCRSSLNSDNIDLFLKDIKTLSLEKYIPEIATAIVEGMSKCKTSSDISAAAKIAYCLHQRFFTKFSTPMLAQLYFNIFFLGNFNAAAQTCTFVEPKEKERQAFYTRQRNIVRVLIELWLRGVVHTAKDFVDLLPSLSALSRRSRKVWFQSYDMDKPIVFVAFTEIVRNDAKFASLPVVHGIVKHYSDILFSDPSSNIETDNRALLDAICPPEWRSSFRSTLQHYYEKLLNYLQTYHAEYMKRKKQTHDLAVNRGEVNEERMHDLSEMLKVQERIYSSCELIANVLQLEKPDIPSEDSSANANASVVAGLSSSYSKLTPLERSDSIWEHDDERKFYEDLLNLSTMVPESLLPSIPSNIDTGSVEHMRDASIETLPITASSELNSLSDLSDSDDSEDGILSIKTSTEDVKSTTSVAAQVNAYLLNLPTLNNPEAIDKAAVEFCFINSKASRNRLIKTLTSVNRTRSDLLPYYCRLVAILKQISPDIANALVDYARRSFKRMLKKKAKHEYHSRVLTIRYISELTKFRVMPLHITFHCFRLALTEFTSFNIEVLSLMLENCGRFLFRLPESSAQMLTLLETIQRKKDASVLAPQDQLLLDNALYHVNPPKRALIEVRTRPILEQYLCNVIYKQLNTKTYRAVAERIRKIKWGEQENTLFRVLAEVWHIQFDNLKALALLIQELIRYHPEDCYEYIDDLFEDILLGVETRQASESQKIMSRARLLGELYASKVLDATAIFNLLFSLLQLVNTSSNNSNTGSQNATLMEIENHFVCRVICTILNACGPSIGKGKKKKPMNTLLLLLQCQCLKEVNVPLDVVFDIRDTIKVIRPKLPLYKTLAEVQSALENDKLKAQTDHSSVGETTSVGGDADHAKLSDLEDAFDSDSMTSEVSLLSGDMETMEEEPSKLGSIHTQSDISVDEEFETAFAKMMNESMTPRQYERKPMFEVPLPLLRYSKKDDGSSSPGDDKGESVKFTMITRRGNRQQTRSLNVPSSSAFAMSTKSRQDEERMERKRMKDLVLSYELMDS